MVEILFAQALKTNVKRILYHHDRGFGHPVAQAFRQMVRANHPALILQHPTCGIFFQQLDGQMIFKACLGKLWRQRAAKR